MVDFQRHTQSYDSDADSVALFIKRKAQRKDKNGIIYDGDIPNQYLDKYPAWYNKDATLGNKDNHDLDYDFDMFRIALRLHRQNIPDEDYDVDDMINEFNMEYSAVGLDTSNKQGFNRKLLVTNISQSTSEQVLKEEKPSKTFSLFNRK